MRKRIADQEVVDWEELDFRPIMAISNGLAEGKENKPALYAFTSDMYARSSYNFELLAKAFYEKTGNLLDLEKDVFYDPDLVRDLADFVGVSQSDLFAKSLKEIADIEPAHTDDEAYEMWTVRADLDSIETDGSTEYAIWIKEA